eukprot:4784937-Lingulodinium_polyedra.AAC.1
MLTVRRNSKGAKRAIQCNLSAADGVQPATHRLQCVTRNMQRSAHNALSITHRAKGTTHNAPRTARTATNNAILHTMYTTYT